MRYHDQDLQRLLPVFDPASPEARAIYDLFIGVSIVAAAIFLLVAALIAHAVIRYRARPGEPDPPFGATSYRVEIGWTLAPLLLLAIIYGFALRAMERVNPDTPGGARPDIVIRGHQWWWEARYPATGAVAANEIHIPVGRPVLARIESADVIHSFWVPPLARKIDMIPGRRNHLWFEADSAGTYVGRCAEYCGAQHAHMQLLVIAEPDSAFRAWQAAQLAPPARPATALQRTGMALLADKACLSCHSIGGTGARVAPDLTHVASRRTLAAVTLPNTPGNLARWLRDPGAIKPGTRMPDFELTDGEVSALAAYLGSLR